MMRVHHALHGYADGHRLIACSKTLSASDAKTLLTLSDASGSTSGIDPEGYLTGYPLNDSGVYALARTWPAHDMPRPGCVWTHTLLIDFADLASLSEMAALEGLFRRPLRRADGEIAAETFERPIRFEAEAPTLSRVGSPNPSLLVRVLCGLYLHPERRVVSSLGEGAERDTIVLSVWSQQWPRLRRSFRFCTQSLGDRSTKSAPFDIQFAPDLRSAKSRFSSALLLDSLEIPPRLSWLSLVTDDILDRRDSSLREFLRQVGAELDGGRALFSRLCTLYALVADAEESTASAGEAIALLEGPLAELSGSGLRGYLVRAVSSTARAAPLEELESALKKVVSIRSEENGDLVQGLAPLLWSLHPERVGQLLESGDQEGRRLGASALSYASNTDLLEGVRRFPALLPVVLQHRADVLREAGIWESNEMAVHAVEFLSHERHASPGVLDAMVCNAGEVVARRACRALGQEAILERVLVVLDNSRADLRAPRIHGWLRASASPNALARLLSDGRVANASTLYAIARVVGPDDIPNEYGEDPCFVAAAAAKDEDCTPEEHLYLSSWLFARAIGYRSRNRAGLILLAVDDVYTAVRAHRMPRECYELFERRLPNALFGEWDVIRRVCEGVVNVLMDREWSPASFGRLPVSEDAFVDFAETARARLWGRRFLVDVLTEISREYASYGQRIGLLERLI